MGDITGHDHIAGTAGERSRTVAIGSGIEQRETRAQNYFDFGKMLRERFEEGGVEEGMGELSKLLREFHGEIKLLKYRLGTLEQKFNVFIGVVILLLLAIVIRVFFWV
jgi:hypothetical protein